MATTPTHCHPPTALAHCHPLPPTHCSHPLPPTACHPLPPIPPLAAVLEAGINVNGRCLGGCLTYESNVLFALRFMIDLGVVGAARCARCAASSVASAMNSSGGSHVADT